jgi:Fe2+ or Zn2+ uptake regulation protein
MLMIHCSTLPVVNDDPEAQGIVSYYNVLNALNEKWMVHEFSAESRMSCRDATHAGCMSSQRIC